MAGSKNYHLKVWPQNNTVYNTKKYTIIKHASIPLHIRLLVALMLLVFAYYYYLHDYLATTADQSFDYRLLIAALQRSGDNLYKILINLFVFVMINYVLASIVLQNDVEESITVIKNMGVELISTSSRSSLLLPSRGGETNSNNGNGNSIGNNGSNSGNGNSFWIGLISLIANNFLVNMVVSVLSHLFFFLVFFNRNKVKHEETFIPIDDIEDIIIHEAFNGFEVVFYMIILRKSTKKLTIVFKNLLPRRHQLEPVLHGSRKVLFYGRDDDMLKFLVDPRLQIINNS